MLKSSSNTNSHRIAIAGDVFLGGQLADEQSQPQVTSAIYESSTHRIFNLESPLTDRDSPIDKSVLSAPLISLTALKTLKPTAVALSNNHIHDMGTPGIQDTMTSLSGVNVGFTGAGLTSTQAAKPFQVTKSLFLLSYCQFDRPTLNHVQPATNVTAGMNPLTLQGVQRDLDILPDGTTAILYMHWGEEHLFLPSPEQIELSRTLLENEKVSVIVGSHAHRAQGYLEVAGKRAYFGLGNFLFPNFLIAPPNRALNVAAVPTGTPVSRRYHSVDSLTYKKWWSINRISLVIEYDSQAGMARHFSHYQLDDVAHVKSLENLSAAVVNMWIWLLSTVIKLPPQLYAPIYSVHSRFTRWSWRTNVILHMARTKGWSWFLKKIQARLFGT